METLPQAWDLAWNLLKKGETHRKHPFHSPVVTTIVDNRPQARVVILRLADIQTESLRFHTDYRSPKIQQLKAAPSIQWLFYSFPDKIQIRASGTATANYKNDITQKSWSEATLLARRCYSQVEAPSTPSSSKTHGLPDHLADRQPTEEEAEPGYENFCVVSTKIHELDILNLSFTGHSRAVFTKDEENWHSTWLYP